MSNQPHSDKEAFRKIKYLIGLRVLLITLFLGSLIVFHLRKGIAPSIFPYMSLIVLTYLLSISYALTLPRIKNYKLFSYCQIVMDLLTATAVVYFTGGMDSVFSFLYILAIVSASIVLDRKGTLAVASMAGILFGGLTNLQFYGMIGTRAFYMDRKIPNIGGYVFYTLFFNIAAFFLVALLSGHLSEKLKRTGAELEERKFDLIELRRFHEKVVESMNTGLFTTRMDGGIASFNTAAEEITGCWRGEAVGKPCWEIFDLPRMKAIFQGTEALNPENTTLEGYIVGKEGKRAYIVMNLSRLRNDAGDVMGLIGSFQDLTPMKVIEEKMKRSERLAALGTLAAGLAHEIRNPLASISGSIEMLRDTLLLDGTEKRLMDILLKETERLNGIVTQFLSYARSTPPRKEPVEVGEIIKNVVALLKNDQKLGEKIGIHHHQEGAIRCMADPTELTQVLWNLSMNSLQAMDGDGHLTFDASLISPRDPEWAQAMENFKSLTGERKEDAAAFVKIMVKDTGKGIPLEELSKIFDPFYTTKESGLGLGLTIAQKNVEKHGGFIRAESALNGGTSVSIYLPSQG